MRQATRGSRFWRVRRGNVTAGGSVLFRVSKFLFGFRCFWRKITMWYEILSMVPFGVLVSIYVLWRSDFEGKI